MNPRYRYSFAPTAPIRHVNPGEIFTVEMPDSDGLGPDLQRLPASLFEEENSGRGNPVFGPVSVAGASPGDALEVHFLDIKPNREIARTLLARDHGFLPDAYLQTEKPKHMYLWEVKDGHARLSNPLGRSDITLRSHPFLGCVATAGRKGADLSTMLAGDHGGNLDHPDLVAGTSLFLPVLHPEGLLYLGDMHAAQGHGETAGGALEISGSATLRIALHEGRSIPAPRYRTPAGLGCLGIGGDLREATRLGLSAMIRTLADAGQNLFDANMLVSQTCTFRMGAVTDRYAVVSCFLDSANLPVGV